MISRGELLQYHTVISGNDFCSPASIQHSKPPFDYTTLYPPEPILTSTMAANIPHYLHPRPNPVPEYLHANSGPLPTRLPIPQTRTKAYTKYEGKSLENPIANTYHKRNGPDKEADTAMGSADRKEKKTRLL